MKIFPVSGQDYQNTLRQCLHFMVTTLACCMSVVIFSQLESLTKQKEDNFADIQAVHTTKD